jgi:hypothetical protein
MNGAVPGWLCVLNGSCGILRDGEDGKWDCLGRAQEKDGATAEVKNGRPIAWKGIRAHVGRNRSEAVGRRDENGQRVVDHDVSSDGIRLRARS